MVCKSRFWSVRCPAPKSVTGVTTASKNCNRSVTCTAWSHRIYLFAFIRDIMSAGRKRRDITCKSWIQKIRHTMMQIHTKIKSCNPSSPIRHRPLKNTRVKTFGLSTHPWRTPALIAKPQLRPELPTTLPSWLEYRHCTAQTKCCEMPWSRRDSRIATTQPSCYGRKLLTSPNSQSKFVCDP